MYLIGTSGLEHRAFARCFKDERARHEYDTGLSHSPLRRIEMPVPHGRLA
jgi:hypothetical protein